MVATEFPKPKKEQRRALKKRSRGRLFGVSMDYVAFLENQVDAVGACSLLNCEFSFCQATVEQPAYILQ